MSISKLPIIAMKLILTTLTLLMACVSILASGIASFLVLAGMPARIFGAEMPVWAFVICISIFVTSIIAVRPLWKDYLKDYDDFFEGLIKDINA
jgi:hypothetical protein